MAEVMLSAVVCCYRDAPALPMMHERLSDVFRALGVDYEIIFVNDASPDDADLVLKRLAAADEHVLAIEHSRNFGSQSAFVSGMQLARGDAVVLLDGDLQDPPELIAEFFSKWKQGYEVVYGRRVERQGRPALTWMSKAFYRVFDGLSSVPMPRDAGDFALMDRRVVDELLALPETDQFLRGLRAWVGFSQIGIDYVRPERVFGRSTHGWMKNVWWAKKGIFSFTFLPIEVLGYGAAVMTALSFCAASWRVVYHLVAPGTAQVGWTLVAVVAFFGSANLLALALLGEYLGKILEESKRRPKFIRKAVRYAREHLVSTRQIEEFRRARTRSRTEVSRGKPGG